jgi:hypothetical protein
MPVKDIGEIVHPSFVIRDSCADQYTFENLFNPKMTVFDKLYKKIIKIKDILFEFN